MTRREARVAALTGRSRFHQGEFVARWGALVTVAECVGFAVPATVGVATAYADPAVVLPAILAAGAVEGALLGGAQALVLGPELPALRRVRWVLLTVAAAVLAYAFGMAPSTWASGIFDAPVWVQILGGALMATVVLASIGGLQCVELRRHLRGAAHWIWITAVAWLAAIGAFMAIATPLWQPGQPIWLAIGIGVVAGAIMAAIQAYGTGWGMARMLHANRRL